LGRCNDHHGQDQLSDRERFGGTTKHEHNVTCCNSEQL
jgi:hypothetical protein